MTIWNLGQDVCRQIRKVKQDRFLYGMVYCDFLPESVKIWVLVGLLGTCYQVQAFYGLSSNFLIS